MKNKEIMESWSYKDLAEIAKEMHGLEVTEKFLEDMDKALTPLMEKFCSDMFTAIDDFCENSKV